MIRNTLLATAALLGLAGATTANAAVFDFLAEANKREAGYTSRSPYTLTNDGLTVTARGFYNLWEVAAYLDAGDAGLGVCKVLDANRQCVPGNDDNITANERVRLTFDRMVTITNTFFRTDGHTPQFPNKNHVDISVDGVKMTNVEIPRSNGDYAFALTGTSFEYAYNDVQLYISSVTAKAASAVPEPASVLLLGVGAMGLALARRRRRG